jgi:Translation initiation factor IF-2, N-terminal region
MKGMRLNSLAKVLGVESKVILQKLKDEGLGNKVFNHMSTLSVDLEKSVREWFGGDTKEVAAAETNTPQEAANVKTSEAKPSQPVPSDIQTSPQGRSFHKFIDCMSYWPGVQDEGLSSLVKRLIGHFESHLANAKEAQVIGNEQELERFVQAALLIQFSIFEGCVSLLWNRCRYGDGNTPNALKFESLCKLASEKTGKSVKGNFRYRNIRDGILHARSDSLPSMMPSPEEVQRNAAFMDELLSRLDSVLQ